ncbi:hypothetical protein GOP47_0000636 [Adiantum capillus-veneris]|uniref:Uncharacterized protein n=1 Tax=Adiantum capillus-veneris TaxID=13818 RepID=A0A9D4VDX0_ADICA|nr:hypothetical protein GOP47_0000636 [Adiantum capillus-veneris]
METDITEGDNEEPLDDDGEDYDLVDLANILTKTKLSSGIFIYFNAKLTTLEKVHVDVVTML